jgi:nucleotide-binding universal stress UspA family protein
MRKGVQFSRVFGGSVLLAAAYDPAFHTKIFRVMSRSLTAERQEEVGLNKQEDLHDQIIDDGLGKLYQTFLDEAEEQCRVITGDCRVRLVQDKAFKGLLDILREEAASLTVVGRFGHNRTDFSRIGSNSEAIAALSPGNVLITALADGSVDRPAGSSGAAAGSHPASGSVSQTDSGQSSSMTWSPDAEKALARVPSFARPMARGAVEKRVRAAGRNEVSLRDFRNVAAQFGMMPGGGQQDG